MMRPKHSSIHIKRGAIYTLNFGKNAGSIQNGVRPVVVLQNNTLNRTSTTTLVAPITSSIKKKGMSSHIVIGKNYGLSEESMILLEQTRIVNIDELASYVGTISDYETLNKIENGLRRVFSLGSKKSVRYLCPDCLSKAMKENREIFTRVNNFEKSHFYCERCKSSANRYFVAKRQFTDVKEAGDEN